MEPLKAYVLIANRMYNDGIRSALGLSVENHYARPVILHGEFPKFSKYMADNIAWIADMEGEVFTCGAPAPENLPTISSRREGSAKPQPQASTAVSRPKTRALNSIEGRSLGSIQVRTACSRSISSVYCRSAPRAARPRRPPPPKMSPKTSPTSCPSPHNGSMNTRHMLVSSSPTRNDSTERYRVST